MNFDDTEKMISSIIGTGSMKELSKKSRFELFEMYCKLKHAKEKLDSVYAWFEKEFSKPSKNIEHTDENEI